MNLYLDYETNEYVIDEPEEGDGPWLYQGSTGGHYMVTDVHLSPGWRDCYPTDEEYQVGDEVIVVWVSYSTGSTFGSTGGNGQIIAVTKNVDLATAAYEWIGEDRGYNDPYGRKNGGAWPAALGDEPYTNWIGYFESLEAKEMEFFRVKP